MSITSSAQVVWKHLNGFVCLYKPANRDWLYCQKYLQNKIASDLNSLECRKPKDYVTISGDTTKPLDVSVGINYADHPLVVGPRYIANEIKCETMKYPGDRTSGVFLVGINNGITMLDQLKKYNPLSTYHVTGQFGICTHNKAIDGNILYTCNYEYLQKSRIDKAVAAIESIHRKNLIKQCGFYPQTQEAYELLASGNLRPLSNKIPVIYSIKCIDWQLPYFTLEIVIANEEEDYLLYIIDEIGLRVKNIAAGVSLRCLRRSFFSLDDALLQKHWRVQYLLDNMNICRKRMESHGEFNENLKQIDESIIKYSGGYTDNVDEDLEEELDLNELDMEERIHLIGVDVEEEIKLEDC